MDDQYSGKERRVRFKDPEATTLFGTLAGMTDVFAALVVVIAVFFLTSTGKVDNSSSVNNHHASTSQGGPRALKNLWPVFADMLYEGEDVPKPAAPPVESKPVESQPVDTGKHFEKNEPVESNTPVALPEPPKTIVDWPSEASPKTPEDHAAKHAPVEAETVKSWWSSVVADLTDNNPAPQEPTGQKQEPVKAAQPEAIPETKNSEQPSSPAAALAEPTQSSNHASKSGPEIKNRALSFLRSVLAGYEDDEHTKAANPPRDRSDSPKQPKVINWERKISSAAASWSGDWWRSLVAQEEDTPVADYTANVFVTGESEVIKTPQRAQNEEGIPNSKSPGKQSAVLNWLKSQVADKFAHDEDNDTPKQARKESRGREDPISASWGGDWLGSLVVQEGDVPVADYTADVFITGDSEVIKTPQRVSIPHEKGSDHHGGKPDMLHWLKSHLTDNILTDGEEQGSVPKRSTQRAPSTDSGKPRNEPSFTDPTSESLRSCVQGYYGLDPTFDKHCAQRCPEGKCSASVCGCGPAIRNNRVCANNRYVALPGKDFLCQTSCNLPPFQCPKNHCACENPDMEHHSSRCVSPRVCKRQEFSAVPGTIATTEWCNRTCRRGSYCPCTLCECAVTCSDGLLNGDFSNGLAGWNVVRQADSEGIIKALPDGHQAPLSGKRIPAKSAVVEEEYGDEEVDSTDYIALFDHASPGSYVLYQEITPARGDVLVFSWFVANYAKNYHVQDETMAANVYRNQQFRVDIVEPFSVDLAEPEIESESTSEPEVEEVKDLDNDDEDDSLEWESSVQWATVKGAKAPVPPKYRKQPKKVVTSRPVARPAQDAKLYKTGSWFGVDSDTNGVPVLATVLSPEKVRSIMNAVGHPPYRHLNPWQTLRYDLSDFDGKTVWLAFRAVNNQGILNVAIDEISVVNRICNPGPSTPATREAKLADAKHKLSAPLVVQTGSPSCGDVCSFKFSSKNLG